MSRPMADPLVSTRAMVCGWQSSATKNFFRFPFLSPLHLPAEKSMGKRENQKTGE